jgi:hypothetical protein
MPTYTKATVWESTRPYLQTYATGSGKAAVPGSISSYRKSFFKPALRVAGLAAVRPAAHLRVAADRPRRQREGCAGAARARDASITLDTYGHLFPSELEALADRLERARATALADHRERTLRGPAVVGLDERAGG